MTWGIVATMAATLVRDVRLPKAREEWYTCAMKNVLLILAACMVATAFSKTVGPASLGMSAPDGFKVIVR